MVKFEDCPIGLFEINGELCLKTEYGLDAYIVSSGEYFWGGTNNVDDLRNVMVNPIKDVEPVKHAKWAWYPDYMDRHELLCTNCEEECPYDEDGKYLDAKFCPHCGAVIVEE